MQLCYDREELRRAFRSAEPFPFVMVDLLDPQDAREVAASYPPFDRALAEGVSFDFVNERRKVQLTDAAAFPEPVARLHRAVSSPDFLSDLEYITGIPRLLVDPHLRGGGMHLTGGGGRLDVHVDFNFVEESAVHRRLNILIYLNPEWQPGWGGELELWDAQVRSCHHRVEPKLGRCVIFETSHRSYHGVQPVRCPADQARLSFAAYYYTEEPPPDWTGEKHSTVFRARPDERFRGYVLMPLEWVGRQGLPTLKRAVKGTVKRALGFTR